MKRDEILRVLSGAAGSPESGVVAEILPRLADALDAELNGKPVSKVERRIVEPAETR